MKTEREQKDEEIRNRLEREEKERQAEYERRRMDEERIRQNNQTSNISSDFGW